MRRCLPVLALLLVWTASASGHGLLIPKDVSLPPLAMVNHKVEIAIVDQVATTKVEQVFRNHTDRQLEATYVFPVPKGASVNKFSMWVGDKEVAGELLDAPKAKQVYTEIVRRTQDPGLLEYMGNNLFKLSVFPVPPRGDQKVMLSYTSVAGRDSSLVEYIYPLKTDGKATQTLEDFSIKAGIKSQHAVQNVYSPTHALNITRTSDHEVTVNFEKAQALLDKDFQLFYSLGDKDVGLTALTHRPVSTEDGHFMLLLSPKVEMAKENYIPRDMILVLDTSGSMRGAKMEQARRALKYCLDNLKSKDRFGIVQFATSVNTYRDNLVASSQEQVEDAKKWVDKLKATGGTNINGALMKALEMRNDDPARTFTVVFFTDGAPTLGDTTDTKEILKNVAKKNTANTRIFTFGVGESDDLNAVFLDQLAEQTRAVSTFVRPAEDIETKVSSLYNKISHPVLANLKITVGDKVQLSEVYPPQLPDLFHGGQVVVMGRYTGNGPVSITLTGMVGMEKKEFVYEMTFPSKSAGDDRSFVEDLWARRKVGYLLDQIRINGEKKELVDEVVTLAKKYGIATPYTSYLVVPDGAVPVVPTDRPHFRGAPQPAAPPAALAPAAGEGKQAAVRDLLKRMDEATKGKDPAAGLGGARAVEEDKKAEAAAGKDDADGKNQKEARERRKTYEQAERLLQSRNADALHQVQTNKLGVDLSCQTNNLRNQTRLEQTASRKVANRNCIEVGGVWIDDGYNAKMTVVAVKAMSDAYFRILELQPQVKDVFRLGNHLVWVTPSGAALVIDANDGKDKMSDEDINKLFVAKK
jgi:Ca-activated chloride channel family protein